MICRIVECPLTPLISVDKVVCNSVKPNEKYQTIFSVYHAVTGFSPILYNQTVSVKITKIYNKMALLMFFLPVRYTIFAIRYCLKVLSGSRLAPINFCSFKLFVIAAGHKHHFRFVIQLVGTSSIDSLSFSLLGLNFRTAHLYLKHENFCLTLHVYRSVAFKRCSNVFGHFVLYLAGHILPLD